MRNGAKNAVIGGVFAVVMGGLGYGAYALVSDGGGSDGPSAVRQADGDGGPKGSGPLQADEIRTTAEEFLAAWAKGDDGAAAALTDDEAAAKAALKSYREDAHVVKAAIEPAAADGETVPFRVEARVEYARSGDRTDSAVAGDWAYDGSLEVVRDSPTGDALVRWSPAVLHPDLKRGDTLVTEEASFPVKAVDRDGGELTPAKYPSLTTVAKALGKTYGERAGGTPSVETYIRKADDKGEPKTLFRVSEGKAGTLETTIDPAVQAAAEKAVAAKPKTSLVALRPSTGEILAVANSEPDGFNTALQGSLAPGSTMKIVTASLLLDKGLATADGPHPCPKYSSYGGWKFQNLEKFEIKGGTFRDSFGRSCNTAFISQAGELADDDLTEQARDVFGLGRDDWATGVPTFDGAVPVQKDAPKAASLIGQGGVRMNPLDMVSVIATAKTGTFAMPYLVSPSLDDRDIATAPRAMQPSTKSQLKALLTYTAKYGSAAEPMAGLGDDVGAKTGSAEVDGQKKPNAWFTAWRGDVAAAAVVQGAGRGGLNAGPVVRQVLLAGE
ncbi:penicillin-binding transpeptidase domain-containing protein [Streptomyces sp. NPDC060194]|uniref:penicillin-binding transpeptidase domain-containing protein n=1 Tax=Streptomyces sp. NPDC060194 TaxID=3347069 RepID=UPI0036518256